MRHRIATVTQSRMNPATITVLPMTAISWNKSFILRFPKLQRGKNDAILSWLKNLFDAPDNAFRLESFA
jgi:hypothetical protein